VEHFLSGALYAPSADLSNRVSPPSSSLQARLLTYQAATVASQLAPPQTADAMTATPLKPTLAEDNRLLVQAASPDSASKVTVAPKPAAASPLTPATTKSTGTSGTAIFESAALDASPALQSDITIEYPLSANNREGVVSLAITIGADGRVENLLVVSAKPAGFFEAAAIKGFSNARFSAGTIAGVGVKSRMVVEVEFTPTNRGGGVSGQRN
jgi:TonB family protein